MEFKVETTSGSIELKDGEVVMVAGGISWPRRIRFEDVQSIAIKPASDFSEGELRITEGDGDSDVLRFPKSQALEVRRLAQMIDNLSRGRGVPLMPISTGLEIPGRKIIEVVDVITSEAAMGMNLLKDIANSFRDTFGGRSGSIQSTLRNAREACLWELRQEARRRFADAVVGVDLNYTEFSSSLVGGGMILVVASGTAVRLET